LDDQIPYTAQMIATLTRQQIGTVERALQIYLKLGLMEMLPDGVYYMTNIELLIGRSSTEGERKKQARMAMQALPSPSRTNGGHLSGQMSAICPPEIEKEIEIEKELYLEKKRTPSSFSGKKKGGRYGTQNAFLNNDGKKFNKYAGVEKIINSQELVYVPNEEREKYKPATGLLSKPVY